MFKLFETYFPLFQRNLIELEFYSTYIHQLSQHYNRTSTRDTIYLRFNHVSMRFNVTSTEYQIYVNMNFIEKDHQHDEVNLACRGDTDHFDPGFAPAGGVNKNNSACTKATIMLVRLIVLPLRLRRSPSDFMSSPYEKKPSIVRKPPGQYKSVDINEFMPRRSPLLRQCHQGHPEITRCCWLFPLPCKLMQSIVFS